MELKLTLLAVLATLSYAKEPTYYELFFSDEKIFSACPDAAPGTLDLHGLADLSELSISLEEKGILVSGNVTYIWDIQPQDRVKCAGKLLHFDRGTWTPTLISMTVPDYCKTMYDPKHPWNNYLTGHTANVEDVRDKCVYPGTKVILEPYLRSAIFPMSNFRDGLYKFQVTLQAFDADGTERPTNICYEIIGNLHKI